MSKEAMKLALEALQKIYIAPEHEEYIRVWWPACEQAITALREALAEQPAQQEPVNKYCCHLCFNKSGQVFLDRMILCPECGNKRCPKATHHGLPCTKSNDVGQKGSIYDQPAQRTWVGLTFAEICECENDYLHIFARAIEAKLKEKNT